MALRAVCPECGTTETLADDYAQRTVECRRCHHIFATPTTMVVASTPGSSPPKLPTPPPPPGQPPALAATVPAAALPNDNETGFDLIEDDGEQPAFPLPPKKEANQPPPAPRPVTAGGTPAPAKRHSPMVVVLLALFSLIVGGGSAGGAAYFLRPNLVDRDELAKRRIPPDDGGGGQKSGNNGGNSGNTGNSNLPPIPNASDALTAYASNVTNSYTTLQMPGRITDACAGAGGRLLFLFVPQQQQIVVVDVCEAKIRRAIPTASKNVRFTAGAEKLFIVDVATRHAERHDLRTLEKDLEVPKLPGYGEIAAIAMGCASQGPVLVSNTEVDPDTNRGLAFLDPATLTDAEWVWEGNTKDLDDHLGIRHLRATPDGVYWVCSYDENPGKGPMVPKAPAIFLERVAINAVKAEIREMYAGALAITPARGSFTGHRVYSRYGVRSNVSLYDGEHPLYPQAQAVYAPVIGAYSLMMRAAPGRSLPAGMKPAPTGIRQLTVTSDTEGDLDKPMIAQTSVVIPSPIDTVVGPNELPWDRAVFYVPHANMIAVIPGSRDRVELVQHTLLAATRGLTDIDRPLNTYICGNAPPTFTPGQRYQYQASMTRTLANTIMLVHCMEAKDTKISSTGLVTWDAPADFDKPYIDLRINAGQIQAAIAGQHVRVFNTAVRKAPAPKKDPMPKPKDPMPKPKDPMPEPKKDPKSDPPVIPTDFAPGAKLVKAAEKTPSLTPADFTGPSTTVNAPGAIVDLCIGGGGRYLLVHCPTARKVSIFDTTTAKFTNSVPTRTDNVLIAAGIDKLMLVYPEEKLVERWSLATFTKETDKKLDVKQTITAAAMGNATAGPLVLGGPRAQNNASKMALMFVDLDTLKEVKIENAEGKFGVSFSSIAHLRVSANGTLLSAWYKDVTPTGVQMVELSDNTMKGSYLAENAGQVIPSPDGKFVGTNVGGFLPNLDRLGAATDVILPAVQKGGHLHLTPPVPNGYRKVSVVPALMAPAVATFENLPSYDGKRDTFERDATGLTLDQRIIYIPDAKIIVVVPPAANKLHVFKVEPK